MGVWGAIWKSQAKDWTYSKIPASKTPDGLAHTTVGPEDGYLNIWLDSFRLTNVRRGVKNFYGTVYSFISLPVLGANGGTTAPFQVITTPGQLKSIDAAHLDRIVVLNQRLLGPIPYRGGDVEIEIGLVSIKEAELAGPYLSLLESLSKTAGVSYISAALPFAAAIKEGIDLLSGSSSDSILEIGLSTIYSPAETGYFAVMRADRNQVDAAKFRIDNNCELVEDASGKPIANFPYVVFRAEVSKRRNDWFLIPDVSATHQALRNEVKRGVASRIDDAFAAFRRTVLLSPDLLMADAQRLVAEVESEVKAIMGPPPAARACGTIRDLAHVALYE